MRIGDAGKWLPAVLRLLLGAPGISRVAAAFEKTGITPAIFWSWVVAIVEFGGGVGLILGFLTRFWAALLVIEMIVATVKVNCARGFVWTSGSFEVPLVFGVLAMCLVLTGPGGLLVDRAIGLEPKAKG